MWIFVVKSFNDIVDVLEWYSDESNVATDWKTIVVSDVRFSCEEVHDHVVFVRDSINVNVAFGKCRFSFVDIYGFYFSHDDPLYQ